MGNDQRAEKLNTTYGNEIFKAFKNSNQKGQN